MLAIIILSTNAYAAIIHGSVYDLSLNRVDNVVVELNTIPKQRLVAFNGTYSFEVPNGNYLISATYNAENLHMNAKENISITSEGNYVLDLFLYPVFDDEEELFKDLEFEIDEPYKETKKIIGFQIILGIIFLSAIFGFILLKKPKKKNEKMSSDLDKLLTLLEKNHGRMTQKEIRKDFAFSEAKISLMVAELEHLGKVKKIKQGRGNIIILSK